MNEKDKVDERLYVSVAIGCASLVHGSNHSIIAITRHYRHCGRLSCIGESLIEERCRPIFGFRLCCRLFGRCISDELSPSIEFRNSLEKSAENAAGPSLPTSTVDRPPMLPVRRDSEAACHLHERSRPLCR